jgi:hypothetical protein
MTAALTRWGRVTLRTTAAVLSKDGHTMLMNHVGHQRAPVPRLEENSKPPPRVDDEMTVRGAFLFAQHCCDDDEPVCAKHLERRPGGISVAYCHHAHAADGETV